MPTLEFAVSGPEATTAAEALEAVLARELAIRPERRMVLPERTGTEKAVDPVALGALILAIPGAILAVVDLVERMQKRKKAEAVIEQAKQLIINGNVSITMTINGNAVPVPLQALTADKLLELANTAKHPGE